MTEMLHKVQNATGELYLEIGMTQEAFRYFQRAWSILMGFSPSNVKDSQDLVKQKGMAEARRGSNRLGFRARLRAVPTRQEREVCVRAFVPLSIWGADEG